MVKRGKPAIRDYTVGGCLYGKLTQKLLLHQHKRGGGWHWKRPFPIGPSPSHKKHLPASSTMLGWELSCSDKERNRMTVSWFGGNVANLRGSKCTGGVSTTDGRKTLRV